MADDASFHSCCEELQHHSHQHHNHQHQEFCPALLAKEDGGGNGCCCYYSSDTDDEAQFLTASNSPLGLEASGLEASELGEFGDEVGCSGGVLERTLAGDDSRRSPQSPMSASPSQRARPIVVASTVSAPEPRPDRLDDSSDSSDDAAVVCEEFPPLPLASSSRVSIKGLQSAAAAEEDSATSPDDSSGNNSRGDCSKGGDEEGPGDDTAAGPDAEAEAKTDDVAGDHGTAQQLDSCQYYRDNDLTPHRPASRRTRSGPIVRHPFSSDNLIRDGCQQHLHHQPQPIAGMLTGKSLAVSKLPVPPLDTVDFPARLRKRVRFADALGFDLASVVVIAAGSASCSQCNGRELELELEFETFLLDAESELNRGRLFAESQSPSGLLSQHQLLPETMTPTPPEPVWISATPWEQTTPTDCRPVVLESVRFDGPAMELSSIVLNLAPHKSLTARLTFDGWRHQADWSLRYCAESTAARQLTAGTERFRMRLYLPPNTTGLELALRYCAAGREFWDNNDGRNYVFRLGNCDAQ